MKHLTAILLCFPMCMAVMGCAPTATAEKLPTLQEASTELGSLVPVIVDAVRARNPTACDEQLHRAMFLSDRLAEFAENASLSANEIAEIETASKQLYQLFMKAHDSAHGGAANDEGGSSIADEIEQASTQLASLVPIKG